MRREDIENLLIILPRIGMYACGEEKSDVISFIHGYETGALGLCDFTELLSERIEREQGILPIGTGWPGQVDSYAIKKEVEWVDAFQELALETLQHNKEI